MKCATILAAMAALAACGRPSPIAEEANNASALPEPVNETSASPTGAPPANNVVAANGESATATPIPAALQGRWGLTPADCTSTRGDAKGLLVIGPNELRFYESVAVPAANVMTSEDSVGGSFNFTGEGQSWTKYQSLQAEDGRLTRTERDPLASFRYVRCD